MRLHKLLGRFCFLAVSVMSPLVLADSLIHAQLEVAFRNLKSKEYEKAIARTRKPLEALQLNTVEDIILAHKILGVSYCEMGDQPKAAEHFDALVTFSPNETIDDVVRSKPCSEQYATIQKAAKQAQNGTESELIKGTPIVTVTDSSKASNPETSNNSLTTQTSLEGGVGLRYIPFGFGQYKNNQPQKGTAFLSTEAFAFSTAIIGIALFKSEKGTNGTFENPDRAAFYRGLYYGGLGVGSAALIWGIIDAVYVYNHGNSSSASRNKRVRWLGNELAVKF